MTDFSRNFYGDDYADKEKKFNEGIVEIEQKHIDYFKSRKPKFPYQTHDKLSNHFTTRDYEQEINKIWINPGSDLRQDIQQEIIDLFDQIWK